MHDIQTLSLIPARSGSKGIPDKNVRELGGKPLLAWSIEHAEACPLIDRVVVSTDNENYASVAREYGAETPFLRPAEFATDESPDIDTFVHALEWLATNENYHPSIVVHLRPTYPFRDVDDITRAVQILLDEPDVDAVRSLSPAPCTPYKMWTVDDLGYMHPVADCGLREACNLPRQALPVTWIQSASIDVVRTSVILERHSMMGTRIRPLFLNHFIDIDTEEEFLRADRLLGLVAHDATGPRREFCFDIDGVIATLQPGLDYAKAGPMAGNIQIIKWLHDRGHRIILFTARGFKTGIDWKATTRTQLESWGVPYHELRFGKPAADFYLDDRMLDVNLLREFIRYADPTGLEE